MEKKKRRRLKPEVKGILIFLIVIILLSVSYAIYAHVTEFDYTKYLNKIVVTINETQINLKEMSYYIIKVEETGDEYARQYNPESPTQYWGIYMNEVTDSGYVSDLARDSAMSYCIRDNIYAMEAIQAGVELTNDELSDVKADAASTYANMTSRQREVTLLELVDLELIMTKEALAHKYMLFLANQESTSALEAVTLLYDVGGDYYETLKSKYSIEINERVWKKIRPGFITIN